MELEHKETRPCQPKILADEIASVSTIPSFVHEKVKDEKKNINNKLKQIKERSDPSRS